MSPGSKRPVRNGTSGDLQAGDGGGGPVAPFLGRTVGVGGVTHEVCYTGVIGRLKERRAVPHILGSLGGQNQASAHSPTCQARPRYTPQP